MNPSLDNDLNRYDCVVLIPYINYKFAAYALILLVVVTEPSIIQKKEIYVPTALYGGGGERWQKQSDWFLKTWDNNEVNTKAFSIIV